MASLAVLARPTLPFMLRHPAHWIALGFGAGLSPIAPGTVGSLLGWAVFMVVQRRAPEVLAPGPLVVTLVVAFAVGCWCAQRTGRDLGVADHGAIVWDEIVAVYLVLAVLPFTWRWQVAGVVVFRVFDIWKPPPIRTLERRFKNGFGVMVDDLVAAGYALFVLAVAARGLA